GSGTTAYAWDDRNRLVEKSTPAGTLMYAYDDAGNRRSMRSDAADGVAVDYEYDHAGRLDGVLDRSAGGGVTSYEYDAAGNLGAYQHANGVRTTFGFNRVNRLKTLAVALGTTLLANYAYALGPAGHRLSVDELSGRRVEWRYDSLYRLTNETISNAPAGSANGTIGYVYDAVGNRLTRTSSVEGVPSQAFTYGPNDTLDSDVYDANGNTLA